VQEHAKKLAAAVEQTMTDAMEADSVPAGHFVAVREKVLRSTWKPSGAERMREDMRRAVIEPFVLDPETGEVNAGRRRLLEQATNELLSGIPSFSTILAPARCGTPIVSSVCSRSPCSTIPSGIGRQYARICPSVRSHGVKRRRAID